MNLYFLVEGKRTEKRVYRDWVESTFQKQLNRASSLSEILLSASKDEILECMQKCYFPEKNTNLPLFFDGAGRRVLNSHPLPNPLLHSLVPR